MGRAYNCWMLNCWCITWPAGFKRLNVVRSCSRALSTPLWRRMGAGNVGRKVFFWSWDHMELSVSFRPNLLYVKTKDIPIRISQGTETGTDIVVELEKGRKNVLLPRIELLYQDVQLFLPIVPRTPPSRPNCDWVLGYSTWHTPADRLYLLRRIAVCRYEHFLFSTR